MSKTKDFDVIDAEIARTFLDSRDKKSLAHCSTLTLAGAKVLALCPAALDLSGIVEFEAGAAEVLANSKIPSLKFGEVWKWQQDWRETFSEYGGDLASIEVKELTGKTNDFEIIEGLSGWNGSLGVGYFGFWDFVGEREAREFLKLLNKLQGRLVVGYLDTVSVGISEDVLASYQGHLELYCCKYGGSDLLKYFSGHLHLPPQEDFNPNEIEGLGSFRGDLRVHQADPDRHILKILTEHNGALHLDGIERLSVNDAKILAKHRGEIYFDRIESLTIESAKALSEHDGGVYLDQLKEISVDLFAVLVSFRGPVSAKRWAECESTPQTLRDRMDARWCSVRYSIASFWKAYQKVMVNADWANLEMAGWRIERDGSDPLFKDSAEDVICARKRFPSLEYALIEFVEITGLSPFDNAYCCGLCEKPSEIPPHEFEWKQIDREGTDSGGRIFGPNEAQGYDEILSAFFGKRHDFSCNICDGPAPTANAREWMSRVSFVDWISAKEERR